MLRNILSAIVGFVVWLGINVGGGSVLRLTWPEYSVADPTMAFTAPMLAARMVLGVVATLAAGFIAASVAHRRSIVALALGIVLTLFFMPAHAILWDKFPIWYHLFFLLTLLPLSVFGGRLASRSRAAQCLS